MNAFNVPYNIRVAISESTFPSSMVRNYRDLKGEGQHQSLHRRGGKESLREEEERGRERERERETD